MVEALAIYDPDPERDREARFRFGFDNRATASALLAITKWLLGEVGPALALIEEAVAHALETGNIPSLVHTYRYKAHLEMVRGDAEAARGTAEILVKLSQENALTLYAAVGAMYSTWASARLNGRKTGVADLRKVGGVDRPTQIGYAVLARCSCRDRSSRRCIGSLDPDRRSVRPRE